VESGKFKVESEKARSSKLEACSSKLEAQSLQLKAEAGKIPFGKRGKPRIMLLLKSASLKLLSY